MKTSVTVVGELQAETPSAITVVGRAQLLQIPGVNLDDRLRMVPGFTLFRRSSSLVANPTTQGVSLRGIGSSGASRSLVLWDGIPVNDPFGGWVYWTRLSPDQIDRVEILRGASTSVFGDRAMGGAIALFAPSAERRHVYFGYEGGNLAQSLLTAGFAQPLGRFALSGHLRGFTTNGYYLSAPEDRGAADTRAGVDFVAPYLRLDYTGDRHRLYFKSDVLVEDRDNGTQLQRNSTSLGTVSAHYSTGTVNNLSLVGYHIRQEYRQSFSTILAGRNTERLTSRQTVPSEGSGGAAIYRRTFRHGTLLAGGDLVRVEGYSIESVIPTGRRVGGGTQTQHGVFAQANARLGFAQFHGGLRRHEAGGGNTFVSPSGGVTAGRGSMRLRASGYRSFRAPTLNELYREFRAGNAVTQANPALRPESLTGVEAGADWVGETRRLGVTLFHNSIDDIVTNVTLSSTPQQIIRQRRNAASATSRGIEIEARQRFRNWTAEASYLFAESRFSNRLRLPQIPKHQGSAQLTYALGGTVLTAGMRSFGLQFDDDINRFRLPGYAAFQLTGQQKLRLGLSATFALENALDRAFAVGIVTPAITRIDAPQLGAPRLWRLGLRWDNFGK